MSAQPHEPGLTGARPEPTIRSVRAALPGEHRAAFQAEIERTPLHLITKALADWDLRARALAAPGLTAAARRVEDEHAGLRPRCRTVPDAEVRTLLPGLRP